MARAATLTDKFLGEVIWAFADRDGAIPMRRGDVFTLACELGWGTRFADLVAFGPLTTIADEEPVSLGDAREMMREAA